jgi:hypothetical protein
MDHSRSSHVSQAIIRTLTHLPDRPEVWFSHAHLPPYHANPLRRLPKNFRDKWVGSTEGNLEKIFRLIHALGHAFVFIDEADKRWAAGLRRE